jgi:hypothetical protein
MRRLATIHLLRKGYVSSDLFGHAEIEFQSSIVPFETGYYYISQDIKALVLNSDHIRRLPGIFPLGVFYDILTIRMRMMTNT